MRRGALGCGTRALQTHARIRVPGRAPRFCTGLHRCNCSTPVSERQGCAGHAAHALRACDWQRQGTSLVRRKARALLLLTMCGSSGRRSARNLSRQALWIRRNRACVAQAVRFDRPGHASACAAHAGGCCVVAQERCATTRWEARPALGTDATALDRLPPRGGRGGDARAAGRRQCCHARCCVGKCARICRVALSSCCGA